MKQRPCRSQRAVSACRDALATGFWIPRLRAWKAALTFAESRLRAAQLLDGPIDAADDLGHAGIVERLRSVRRLVIVGIPKEGRVRDHDRGVAVFPVIEMIRKIDARHPGRGAERVDG